MSKELVERLRPRWAVDEALTLTAARYDASMREAVTTFLVANNALKSEAATALKSAEEETERLNGALRTANERLAQIDCAGFSQNVQSQSELVEYMKSLASDGHKRTSAALTPENTNAG
jgi:phosphoenolpyruvate-protein kinase (PTS system EI component)